MAYRHSNDDADNEVVDVDEGYRDPRGWSTSRSSAAAAPAR